MKKDRILLIALSCAALVCSCEEEYDYEKKVKLDTPAEVALTVQNMEDTVAILAPKTKTYTVKATASSIADETLTLSIAVDLAKLNAYNKAHNTSWESVPGEAVELSTSSLMLPRYNTTSTTAQLTLKASAMPEDGKVRALALAITKIEGTDRLNMTSADSTVVIFFKRKVLPASGFEFGSGTESDPYIIQSQTDMLAMTKALKNGKKTYFKMSADVDMSDYEDWYPLNSESPYDCLVDFNGEGHKITGLNVNAGTQRGMFAVLAGSFRNVTFVNPVLATSTDGQSGLVAAQIGTADVPSEISDVTITGLTVNVNGQPNGVGGLAGSAIAATLKNISVNATFADAEADGKNATSVGGVVGYVIGAPSSFDNVKISGTLVGAKRCGGIVGNIVKDNGTTQGTILENCSSSMEITSNGERCGGLIGQAEGEKLTVRNSYATGNVTSTSGNYYGGLIGTLAGNSTISRSYATGNVTCKGNHFGGLIGNAAMSAGNSTIEDCYALGNVSDGNSGKRIVGGLIGAIENNGGVTIRRCFAAGDVTVTGSAAGGIIGFFKSGKPATDDMNFTIQDCIAWNKNISNAVKSTWSSGAVVAVSNSKNTVSNCWRRADMVLTDAEGETLYDCPDGSSTSPMTYTGTHNSYYYPYHGKAAAADATISSVAKKIGWPEDVWDLSGDTPKLK
jgi:hypothetical protein